MIRAITIAGRDSALVLGLPDRGMPLILGFSHRAPEGAPEPGLAARASRVNGMDEPMASAVLLPVGGSGFFSWPAIQGHRDGRDWTLAFEDWSAATETSVTRLTARDPVANLAIVVAIDASGALIRMSTTLTNIGGTPYQLDRCMAGTMLVGADAERLTSFEGSWGREFHRRLDRLGAGLWLQESRRGRTSHDRSPTLFLEGQGIAYGLHLGASGNHVLAIDRLDDGRRLAHAGELFEPGEMRLGPGERYESPVLHFGLCAGGLPGLGDLFVAHVRHAVLDWPQKPMRPRPVTLNTWEGNYFSHDLENLKAQASAAATLGIERFVLDDGWFGRRDDDTSSLGDWDIDPRKYPDGLGPLVDHVTGLGMEFGLWFEPEMINPDSDLYRAHPDWALQVAGRPLLLARHQLVLDLTRPEIADHIFAKMDAVLSAHPIAYIKWDMNRDLTLAGGRDGRARTSAQTRAVLALIDRIRAAHPAIEIESCASGGGRVDYGVLRRTHRVWASDCTDALERLAIQDGACLFLPPEIVGSHVSASPNHQTGRKHSLAFRAIVALAFHFGVELNPLTLDDAERDELLGWIALHKRLRPVLHGLGARFRHPVADGRHVYGVFAETGARIVLIVAQGAQMLREQPQPILLLGADRGKAWRVTAVHPQKPAFIRVSAGQQAVLDGQLAFGGADLAGIGLPVPALCPESAVVIELSGEDRADG